MKITANTLWTTLTAGAMGIITAGCNTHDQNIPKEESKIVTNAIEKLNIKEVTKTKKMNNIFFNIKPAKLNEIMTYSNKIFVGVCTKIEEISKDPIGPGDTVRLTFKVADGIKGVEGKNEVIFKQHSTVNAAIDYEVGEKYVLFLSGESKYGLTSPVGLSQGHFQVYKNNANEEVVSSKEGKEIKYLDFVKTIRSFLNK